jgi:hypothetical protein
MATTTRRVMAVGTRDGQTSTRSPAMTLNMLNPITNKPFTYRGAGNISEWWIYDQITSPYLDNDYKTGVVQVRSNNCIDLDIDLKRITDQIAKYTKIQAGFPQEGTEIEIQFLAYTKNLISTKFNSYKCLDKIEETRLDETAKIATITSIEAEKTVLGKSDLETKIYILIGSAVLITTIILLTQDKK